MFPHGLTNSPTQSNQRGVGLEPTACGRGKFVKQVFGLCPWPLGLSPCCDYSIAHLYLFVNTFLKLFSKKRKPALFQRVGLQRLDRLAYLLGGTRTHGFAIIFFSVAKRIRTSLTYPTCYSVILSASCRRYLSGGSASSLTVIIV
jgi:hypothetical protein